MNEKDNIEQFVHKLQSRKGASFSVYGENKTSTNTHEEVKVKDVLKTVSKQIMTIKNADLSKDVRKNTNLSNHNKCELLPLTLMQVDTGDTQLIDFVRIAEAQIQEDKENNKVNRLSHPNDKNETKNSEDLTHKKYDHMKKENDVFNTDICKEKQYYKTNNILDNNDQILNINSDICKESDLDKSAPPKSPILNRSKSTSKPFVCNLEDFDNFESLAVPVLKGVTDFDDAKRIISSQLKAKNMVVQTHAEPNLYDRDKKNPGKDIKITKNWVFKENSMNIDENVYSFDVKNMEDKMLFDSDDEKLDLPSTCELETSYNESDVLDKALYVGFQTASNRSIQILADSFNKARSVFDDVSRKIADDISVTELVEVFDRKSIDNLNLRRDTSDNSSKIVDVCNISNNNDVIEKSIKFDTNINNSRKASENIDERLMKEFEINMFDKNPLKEKITNKKNNEIYIESKLHPKDSSKNDVSCAQDFKTSSLIRPEIVGIKCNKILNENNFIGFKTANNKAIMISAEAISKTANIFDNIDDVNYKLNIDKLPKKSITPKPIERLELPLNESNSGGPKKEGSFNKVSEKLEGFKTASNKTVYVSKNALEKSKKLFQDIGEDTENVKTNDVLTKISHEVGLRKVVEKNNVLNEIEPLDNGYTTQTSLIQGFTTASNKPVTISKEALSKSKRIFQDISDSDCIQNRTYLEGNTVQNNFKVPRIRTEDFSKAGINEYLSLKGIPNKNSNISNDVIKSHMDNTDYRNKENNFCIPTSFVGFQTANNKKVKISAEALLKGKEIFKNVDEDCNHTATDTFNVKEGFIGFQTANRKPVKISEEALIKSRQIFKDIDLNKGDDSHEISVSDKKVHISGKCTLENKQKNQAYDQELRNHIKAKLKTNTNLNKDAKDIEEVRIKEKDKKEDKFDLNLEDLLNTEVIKNFDESLHTEDCIKDTPKSKRSGSPIISCPRPKKKKFEPPKSINRNIKNNIVISKTINTYKFDYNYKKTKKYKLKDISRNNFTNNIDSYILKFNFGTYLNFRFENQRNDIDSDVWDTDKMKKYFTDNVNAKIIPQNWVDNHMRLIIWKLISYEIYFGDCMRNACSVRNVLNQLKYRYNRELYNVERPALRKILERDDVSTKMIVLCVASLYEDGVSVNSVTNLSKNIELLLTDGWYCVKANTGRVLQKLIFDGKISIGTKLAIHGAELMNCDQGISPWEDTSSVRLKLSGNSTKRARWDARLGFHGNAAMLTPLSAVKVDGGKISKLRVLVTRVYPTMYIEKFEDGSTVTRSERLELLHQMKYEADRQLQMEKLYEEAEKIYEQESQDSEQLTDQDILETGSQISRMMIKSKDPSEFKSTLTSSQIHKLNEHTHRQKEILIQKIEEKVNDLMKKRGIVVSRNVVRVMKIRVADVNDDITKALITIWRPNESVQDVIKEGAWIDVYNTVPTSIRYSELQISAGRQSIFCKSKHNEKDNQRTLNETFKRKCYSIKDLQSPMTSQYNEVDTSGVVFLIEPENFDSNKQLFQNIYISGINKDIISINFWGGIKKFGYENILNVGNVIACVNLQKRAGNTKSLPQYRATEFTYFTKTPKFDELKTSMDDFLTKFNRMDRIKFVQDCIALRNNYCNVNNDVSPYRNYSDYNMSKNKIFIQSPFNGDSITNCYGKIKMESNFNEETANNSLRKKKVNEKIDKLNKYGEPPPLNHIHIRNKTHITSYKSPLISNDVSNSAANLNGNKNNVAIKMSSPVLNRTYVKINPVKLDFRVEDEELDSPPLSLN